MIRKLLKPNNNKNDSTIIKELIETTKTLTDRVESLEYALYNAYQEIKTLQVLFNKHIQQQQKSSS